MEIVSRTEKLPNLWQQAKDRNKKGLDTSTFSTDMPQWPKDLPLGPHLLKTPLFPQYGTKNINIGCHARLKL